MAIKQPIINRDEDAAVAEDRRRGRGALSNRAGRFESGAARGTSTTAGRASAISTPSRPRCARSRRAPSSRATTAPTSPSTSRSIPIAAASTAASIATRARSHCYLGHSAGLDFETKLYAKTERRAACWSASSPTRATSRRRSRSAPTPTPTSRSSASTASRARSSRCWSARSHPVGIVTKSALVVRDIDILARMAEHGLAKVAISVTTLDRAHRAGDGAARGDAGKAARGRAPSRRGGHSGVRDGGARSCRRSTTARSRRILEAAREAGATEAGYVLLRLPLELKDIVPRMAARRVSRPRRPRHPPAAVDARRARLRRRSSASASAGAGPMPTRSRCASAWQLSA